MFPHWLANTVHETVGSHHTVEAGSKDRRFPAKGERCPLPYWEDDGGAVRPTLSGL